MLFYLLDSLLGDLPFASWASRSKGNRHGGGFFYVSIIYWFQALIILLLSGCYCRAQILRSAWGGEPAQMVRSAPSNETWAPHRRPARTALAPPPKPPARGGKAAAGIRERGREAAAAAAPAAASSPPAAHGASLQPGLPVAAERRLPAGAAPTA